MGACGSKQQAVQAGASPVTRELKEEKPVVVQEQKPIKETQETQETDAAADGEEGEKSPEQVGAFCHVSRAI